MNKEEYLKSQKYEISQLTCLFHDTYEDYAKEYGYETRNDTKIFDMESPNGKTMYKTVEKIMTPYLEEIERLNKEIKEYQEELEKADSITQSCIFEGKEEATKSYRKCLNLLERLHSIIKEVREYITSYESIETIQQCEHRENNKGLDRYTMTEMTNRYLKVHDKILEILDKESK